jgi:peroxiredoxin
MGIDLAHFQNSENCMLPIPATFVVGADGVIKARFVEPDFRKRMDPGDVIAALDR